MGKGLRLAAIIPAVALLLWGGSVLPQLIFADSTPQHALPLKTPKSFLLINGDEFTRGDFFHILLKKYGMKELNLLITQTLLDQEKKKHAVAATREERDKKLDLTVEQEIQMEQQRIVSQLRGTLSFEQYIMQRHKMTIEQYRENKRKLLIKETPHIFTLLENDVITEKLVKYFELTHDNVVAAHLLVATEQDALDIEKKLAAGKSFSEMASMHSQDTLTGNEGGIIIHPIFRADYRFRADYPGPEFENAALALEKPGEVSRPVKSNLGWHLIRLIEKNRAKTGSFAELEEEVLKLTEKNPYDIYERQYYFARLMLNSKIENNTGIKIEFLEFVKELESDRQDSRQEP